MAIFYGILTNGGGSVSGVVSKGTYTDPTTAKAAGLVVGDYFTISSGSIYAPEGTVIQIKS